MSVTTADSAQPRSGRWMRHHPALFETTHTQGASRWLVSAAVALALHVAGAAYVFRTVQQELEGNPEDVVNVELTPNPSEPSDTQDDVVGPKVDAAAPTIDQMKADDPDPPAPESLPPVELKDHPEAKAELAMPPAPDPEVALPPEQQPTEQALDKPLDTKPPEEKTPEKHETTERQTAPSQASSGSAALLGGGKRPSAAAQATWRGKIGTHLVHNRRYPQEARANGWEGTARVRVELDANGHVKGRQLEKSSGRPALDDEALALVERADPFPPPPPGMAPPIKLSVPVNFALR